MPHRRRADAGDHADDAVVVGGGFDRLDGGEHGHLLLAEEGGDGVVGDELDQLAVEVDLEDGALGDGLDAAAAEQQPAAAEDGEEEHEEDDQHQGHLGGLAHGGSLLPGISANGRGIVAGAGACRGPL